MSLVRERITIKELTDDQRDQMFLLMKTYYENTVRDIFDHDLNEKDCVLIFFEQSTGKIAGFSTQMIMPVEFNGNTYIILFSGDTIIAKEHWGSMILSVCFGELMMDLIDKYKDKKVYWLLISKGIRTYKYLPTFFIDFYPTVNKETPPEIQEFMHHLGELKFKELYDRTKGIVKAPSGGQFLKGEFQPEPHPNKNHEVFFAKANPGYFKGDELLCLAELSMDNINPFIKRILLSHK